jgi:iron complex outermembrane recepter protein
MVIRSRFDRRRIHATRTLIAITVGTLLGASNTVSAQNAPPAQSKERAPESIELNAVVVTALRKETDVQRTAVAVSVVQGDRLTSGGVTDVLQLTEFTAGLDVSPTSGPYSNFTIRGINNFAVNYFSESAVAVNLDGIYMARPTAQHGLFFDLERIEVLKGPQGTLYGRNATGGAINVITRKPTFDFGGSVNAEVADFGRYVVDGALNIPIGKSTAVRFAAQSADREGFYSDGTGDEETRAGRVSFASVPSEALTINFTGDFATQRGKGGGTTAFAPGSNNFFSADPWTGLLDPQQQQLIVTGPPTNTAFPSPQGVYQDNDFWGVAGEVSYLTSVGTFTAIPGYRDVSTDFLNVSGGFFINEQARSHQPSFEARFASNEDRKVRYLLGVYYLEEDINGSGFFDQSAQGVNRQQFKLDTQSYAGFGQLVWSVVDTVRLTGGVRYTEEEKTITGQTFNITPRFLPPAAPPNPGTQVLSLNDVSNTYDATTWTGGAEWDIGERSLLYVNVGRGFKAGGFFSGPAGSNSYAPERVTSYTLGSKNRFLNNRMQLNAEIFYLDYKDQQISHLDRRPLGATTIVVQATENVGQATTQGAEVELEYLAFQNTTLLAQVQYLDATYDQLMFRTPQLGPTPPPYGCPFTAAAGFFTIDCSGKDATQSPEFVGNLGIEQRFPLGDGSAIVANLSSRYESERETRINYLPQTLADDYTRTNLSLTYRSPDRSWSLSAFVDNIEDDEVVAQTFVHANYPTVNLITASLKPPRTYGARFSYSY